MGKMYNQPTHGLRENGYMLNSLLKTLGFYKPARKKVKLPQGLEHLEVIQAKAWWH